MTRTRWTAALLGLLLISCSDADQFSPPRASLLTSELTFLRFNADAYQVAEKTASFWAVKGDSRTLTLHFADTGQEYLKFQVGPNSLVDQDSVLISVRVDENGAFEFEFSPSGLRFNPSAPAVLALNHARTNGDIDGDGDVDAIDLLRAQQAGVWKRELPFLPWQRIPSANLGSVERSDVYDFTSFGMAVD
jgi:hypothetical protein